MTLGVLADEEPFDETRAAASAASLRDVGAGLDLPAFGSGAMLQLEGSSDASSDDRFVAQRVLQAGVDCPPLLGGETEVVMIESDVGSFPPSATRERASSAAAAADPSLSVSLSMHQAAGAAASAVAGAASGPPSASQGRNGARRLHLLSEPLPVAPSQTDAQGRGGQSKRKRNLECIFGGIGCLGGKDMHPKQNGFTWCKTRYPTLELFNEAVQAGELQRKQIARKGVREGTHCSACLQRYDSEDFPHRCVVAQQS